MKPQSAAMLYLSVACVAAAALAYQLLLLRLLAVVQWHALAGLVVSLALLGHGASGTALALLGERARRHADLLYVSSAAAFGVAAPLCFAVAQRVPFNTLELVWDAGQWPRLAAVYGLLALPFFFAAACFGLAFMRHGDRIPRLYAADLMGAAAGAAALTALLWWLGAESLLRGIALLAFAGAAMRLPQLTRGQGVMVLALVGSLAVVTVPASWIAPRPSQFKGEQQLLAVMGAQVIARAASPYGSLSVVDSPRVPLRHAPGLSLHAVEEPPRQLALFTDGEAMSVLTTRDGALGYLGQMTSALPYRLLDAPRVLVPGSGGSDAVLQALALGARSVTVVEPNPQRLALLRGPLARSGGDVYDDPRVRALAGDARNHLRAARERYDLIQVPGGDSFAGTSSGVLAAAETYLYTVEGVADALERLNPGGLLAYTRWERLPPRDSVKLLATAVAALQARGETPAARIGLVRSWQTSTLVVKNGDLTSADIDAVRAFCETLGFDPAYFPGIAAEEVNRYNRVERPWLHEAAQALLSPQAAQYRRDYKFNIEPATDERPFFFHFLKWRAVPELLRLRGQGGVALLDAGYLLAVAAALQAVLYSLVLILLPLFALRRASGTRATRPALYFLALGLAFLFIEIVWLQRLVLLLGHPLLAASAGLAAFLLFAGLGSACAGAWRRHFAARAIAAAVAAIVVWTLLLELTWPLLVEAVPNGSVLARALAAMLALAPLAFFMGLPFPLGLARLSETAPAFVPWAWGINGCASVLSAVLATLLAMHLGFAAVVAMAAALYVLAALAAPSACPS